MIELEVLFTILKYKCNLTYKSMSINIITMKAESVIERGANVIGVSLTNTNSPFSTVTVPFQIFYYILFVLLSHSISSRRSVHSVDVRNL